MQTTCISDAIKMCNAAPCAITESRSLYQAKKEIKKVCQNITSVIASRPEEKEVETTRDNTYIENYIQNSRHDIDVRTYLQTAMHSFLLDPFYSTIVC